MKKNFIAPQMRVIMISADNILASSIDILGKPVPQGELYAPERHSIWE